MEGQNYLGIYLSKDTATVLYLGSKGREKNILGCFSVCLEEPDTQNFQTLANLITQGCAKREWKFSEVALALDCAMFMQHSIHSEFTDSKQIAATIKFDTEEALATDVSDVAIAFKIISTDQAGSELAAFTAKRKILSDVIDALQSAGLDPTTIEPDINCLARFVSQNLPPQDDSIPLFAMLSHRSSYYLAFSQSHDTLLMRTSLLGQTQDRDLLLAREIPLTTAMVETQQPINHLKVLDSTDSINCQNLSKTLDIEVSPLDVVKSAGAEDQLLADCHDTVDFAIAYGAALALSQKLQTINFRSDFMPFMGKKMRLQKTLRLLSICVTVLAIALGVYFQTKLAQKNKPLRDLRAKFTKDYSAVMSGRTLPTRSKDALKKLGSEKRRIEAVKSGQISVTGQKSIPAKLTQVLAAFNNAAKNTNLRIDSISITHKNIQIDGSTSSRPNTLKLRKAIEENGFEISSDRARSEGGRAIFSLTIIPKQITR